MASQPPHESRGHESSGHESSRATSGRAESRLAGRTAIVTGAARGLGEAIARRLVDDGARVALLDVSTDVAATAQSIDAVHTVVDVADAGATRRAIDHAIGELGGCWLLVNNAGRFVKKPLLDMTLDEWDDVQRVNVRACVTTMQAVVPHMIAAGGGRIVNQASMAAKLGTPGESAYAASKAALVALTRIAAMEFGPHGITVNAVCPGYVLTDLGSETRDLAQVASWEAKSPLGRLATPADVSAAVAHLASDDAAYITGEALNVSGGMCTW